MKQLSIIAGIIFLVGCSNPESPEAIEQQIAKHKTEISDLNEKIADLEQKLKSDTSYQEDESATVVRIKELQPERFTHHIELSGKVEAEEEVFISPEMSGKIDRIFVKEGQRVSKGQLLMKLSTDVTEKTIKEVKTNLQLLTSLYEKQKNLWEQNIGSEVQYLQAKNSYESAEARLASLQEQLNMAEVKAPFSGVVHDISVKEGEIAMPGAPNIHLVNLKDLSIETDVSEAYLQDVRVGEEVEVGFSSYPDMNQVLTIVRVGSVIDNLSRTFEVELELKNPDEKIKPNQLASLSIQDFETDDAMVVPSIIVKQDVKGYYVYRIQQNNGSPEADKVYVETGRSSGDQTMITSGLEPGMKIIVEGYNLVTDGTKVRVLSE